MLTLAMLKIKISLALTNLMSKIKAKLIKILIKKVYILIKYFII